MLKERLCKYIIGPMTYKSDDGRNFLVGIVSSGPTNCGQTGFPASYTRVSSQLDWIKSVMEGM